MADKVEINRIRPNTDPLQPVLKQRGPEYGDYIVMSNKIQAIKTAYGTLAALSPYQREALEMIATKIGRVLTGNPDNEDSWRDIAGYATLVADRIPKPAALPEGTIVEIPPGWRANRHGGFIHRATNRYWASDIMSLREHLGLDQAPKPDGHVVEVPTGWFIDTFNNFRSDNGEIWNGDIFSLRKHLGLDQ